MKLLNRILCLCLALALASHSHADHHGDHSAADPADPHHAPDHSHDHAPPDRCQGLEMDAVAVNEEGIPYFFKTHHMFKGFHGLAELSNASFPELDDVHHLDHIDAAFRMHNEDNPADHDHMFFFLDDQVFSYYQHKLEEGYPKKISEVFPGIPDHLDAAVECPAPECDNDSVIFFKGDDIFHYNVKTKALDKKEFKSMPNCTSAFRFNDHYYCFHGHMFSKFDPKTGEVHGRYPKEARDYFMRCAKFSDDSDHVERERCSRVHLDAITSDDAGNTYAFRGHHFIRQDAGSDTLKSDTIESAFKELHSEVDAAFSYQDHLYMVKDDKVFLYKVGEPHTHVDGYPKTLKEELGVDGPIEAAFMCQDHHTVHVLKEGKLYDVDMNVHPRAATNERPITVIDKIDAAMCGPGGLKVFKGNHYYRFDSTMLFAAGRSLPEQHRVSLELFGCDH